CLGNCPGHRLLAGNGDRPARDGVSDKLVAICFFSANSDKQRSWFHLAAVIGNFQNLQVTMGRGDFCIKLCVNAPQQFRETHSGMRRARHFHLFQTFAVVRQSSHLRTQLTFLRAAAESKEAPRAKCTVMRLPRRIVTPGSGDCSMAIPVPTSTGLSPSFMHCSVTSRTVFP